MAENIIKSQKKAFTYRGKTIEELKALDIREFAKLLPSRVRRTVLRNFQDIQAFVNRAKVKAEKGKMIKTHKRYLPIVPEMVGMKIGVYDGRNFAATIIAGEMFGHNLGEFAPTRSRVKHGSAGVGATKGSSAQAKH
jgi:small subunit ribosomal protein S19